MARWTEAQIQAGFEIFIAEHERLPTAHEIDASPSLPSSRAIQNRFGGLIALREKLGYTETNFGSGQNRSLIASESGARSRALTEALLQWLHETCGAASVQREVAFYEKLRIDCMVATPKHTFGVDLFYADTMRTLQSSVNIKMKKYVHFEKPLFLVVANEEITQKSLNHYVSHKTQPLPRNVQLRTLKNFKKEVTAYVADW